MAIKSTSDGNYLKITSVSMNQTATAFLIQAMLFRNEDARHQPDQFDRGVPLQFAVNAAVLSDPQIAVDVGGSPSTLVDVCLTAGYKYLKTIPKYDGWQDC